MREYVGLLNRYIPIELYAVLIIVLCVGTVFVIAYWGLRHGWRKIACLILVEYVVLIYCSTVIYRTADGVGYNLMPFWSYMSIREGKTELLLENIMNIVTFVIFGILMGLSFRTIKWWQIMINGCLMSLSIEILQYSLRRGFAETDDVMHNTLGCLIGIMVVHFMSRYSTKERNNRVFKENK